MGEVTVDFVAFDEPRDACAIVLVEGPWLGPTEEHLSALQNRMFECLEAALDGQLADQFPKSRGKSVIIRIDCYDLPRKEVDDFVYRFSEGINSIPDYTTEGSSVVKRFLFEVNHDTLTAST